MEKVLLVIHVLSAIGLVAIILLQRSEGGALSGLGGGGNPASGMFTARGTATALSRTTALLAIVFMITALLMAASISNTNNSVLEKVQQPLVVEQVDGEVPIAE